MFTAPLWLYGLASLAIPLALHLWSRRPRDVIRVGSLRHVTELAEARSWSARLIEPILLALRLAILACIVLGLAGPRLGAGRLAGSVSRLVLVEPSLLLDSALIRSDSLLDSLARSRAIVRLLTPGLPKVQLDGTRSAFRAPRSAFAAIQRSTGNAERGMIWDLLVSADHMVSRDGEMIVIARPRVAVLGGRRPAIRARVRWHTPHPAAPATWTAVRWSAAESLVTLTGWGDTRGIAYRHARIPAGGDAACDGCSPPRSLALLVLAWDQAATRRIRLACMAVAELLGQQLSPATEAGAADLILTTAPLTDSLLRIGRPVVSLDPEVVVSAALADTVLAHWPWQPLRHDPGDPREVSMAQALPAAGFLRPAERRDARVPLLLFALALFVLERWIVTHPVSRSR